MNDTQFGTHAGLPKSDTESMRDTDTIEVHLTPGEVMAQIGGVIAICLGLALLAHVLIAAQVML